MNGSADAPFKVFEDSLMLRFDISGSQGKLTHYITPFVTDGLKLYVFDEPSHNPDKFIQMLLDQDVLVSSRLTGNLRVQGRGRLPTRDEEDWARPACTEKFLYDQALQDLALLGPLVVLDNSLTN
ncbi:MAG: hypothetical protein CL456_09940 [Acidimicrobiaceae bacterium]|nr:hypothetical protein [Acidimicrobiaceae bacterium]|tara:strand:+ start:933 stop:1307 length:375 start_codon:yes stop_codon:yes gene_type:complete